MLHLANGCSCSNPTINPTNWLTGGPSLLKKQWYIQYYFRDPAQPPEWQKKYPYGKLIIIKRVNNFSTLAERRMYIKGILDNEINILQNFEYNPITGHRKIPATQIPETKSIFEVDPKTPFIEALKFARSKLTVEKATLRDIKSIVKYCEIAAGNLQMFDLPVAEVKMKHIKVLLDEVGKTPLVDDKGKKTARNWTENNYNVYRKYLHRLFEELIQLEACDHNPVANITRKSVTQKMRLNMSVEERRAIINVHLKQKYYNFYRFCQIFFHSGKRIKELTNVKVMDVDLKEQVYKLVVKKGKNKHEQLGTIKDIALPFWKELLEGANPEDYIFAHGLKPGPVGISSTQITRRWKVHVKDKLSIKADIYSLKHSNLDEIAANDNTLCFKEGVKLAQGAAGHTTPVITINRYLHGAKLREHLLVKGIANDL